MRDISKTIVVEDRGYTAPAPIARRGGHMPGIDVLRYAAALAVMVFHLACLSWTTPSSPPFKLLNGAASFPEALELSWFGWIGVQMFFVISGFVIAYSAEGVTAPQFLKRRILRLVPAAWLCATISFALAVFFFPETLINIVVLYLKAIVFWPKPEWIDVVYWTLGVEISFYAVVYVLLLKKRFAKLEATMLTVGLGSALVWLLAATGWVPGLDALASKRIARLLLVTHGCYFAAGALFYLTVSKGFSTTRVIGMTLCLAGSLCQIDYDASFYRAMTGATGSSLYPDAVFLCSMAVIVSAVLLNDRIVGVLGSKADVVRTMGLSTYPLYLIHTFVGVLAMRGALDLGASRVPGLLVGMAAAMIAAYVITAGLEPGLRRAMARGLDRESPLRSPPDLKGTHVAEDR